MREQSDGKKNNDFFKFSIEKGQWCLVVVAKLGRCHLLIVKTLTSLKIHLILSPRLMDLTSVIHLLVTVL